ncbi:MAG: AAA family ATPase [Turicibacter sp.]|nr:AAA family ATPase [Turicibacter sp.]
MEFDQLMGQVYIVAVNEARLSGHEFITPELFLYSIILFDVGKELLESHGVNVANTIEDLQEFLNNFMPSNQNETPTDSYGLIKLFEFATTTAASVNRKVVTLSDFVNAIFYLQESHAQYILLKNGFDRFAPIKRNAKKPAKEKSEIKYAADLCQMARENRLDPLIGREDVIERTIHVLCRRLKNNPMHVGDPGVGKTAIAEGLAQHIVAGKVPKILKEAQILRVDMGALLAGTRYRGEFEERLVKLLEAVEKLKKPILYIDEIHAVVGAGAVSGGGMDATDIIKPYLSRGDIRFIGSTTFDDFKKYFEKDRALVRRFQRIDLSEPSTDECIKILSGIKDRYESFHGVKYSEDTLKLIVNLSSKHMHERKLPDKAIDVMDEVGVMVSLRGQSKVSESHVERTVAQMAKVPINSVTSSEKELLKGLEANLNAHIFGQEEATAALTQHIMTARSGLGEKDKPVANLLFVGPTGVGKTEIAKKLADILGIALIRFDMSEYQERHAVARLIGSPPGYVGFEEGGLLTESIRRTPHAVLLLDEIEKAHLDILNVLLQVMDYGRLTDNSGRQASFSDIILIMTSNAGAVDLEKKTIGFGNDFNTKAIDTAVDKFFSPEFRNRLDGVLKFNPVDEKMAALITDKAMRELNDKLKAKNVTLTATKTALDYIARKGLSKTYGAREIIRTIDSDIKKLLVNELLFGRLEGGGTAKLVWDKKNESFNIRISNKKPQS